MDKLTIERLERKIKNCIEIEDCQVMLPLSAAEELLAFREAAKNPVAFVDERGGAAGGICWAKSGKRELSHGTELYAAPVLPKQPELMSIGELLHRLEEQTGEKWVEESEQSVIPGEINSAPDYVKALTKEGAYIYGWNECRAAAHHVIPDEITSASAPEVFEIAAKAGRLGLRAAYASYAAGWNAYHAAILKAQQNEPQNISENIPAASELRISDDDLVAVPRSVLACAGYAYGKAGLKDGDAYAQLRSYFFTPAITAQPVSEQPVSEPYKFPVGYFSYGTEHGFNWHQTAKQATDDAEAMIDDYRGDACDGWSEETDNVCWGVILQQATKVDERPRTDDDNDNIAPHIDTVCDYALLPELVGNSPVIPDGWKLVPIEPTAAMFHAFNDCDYGRKSMRERYIQMIEAAPAHTLSEHSAAIKDVITERQRQVSEEGWTPAHDDQYADCELTQAAICYIDTSFAETNWPWAAEWWKPTNPRRDLVKAGSLILAEIERMDRTAPAQESE